jgi:ferredoxin-NADP reductase
MMSIDAQFLNIKAIAKGTSAVQFNVGNSFSFISGQYITINLPELHGSPVKDQFHDFTISSSPDELPIVTITYRDSESLFKKTLAKMKPGDQVKIEGPKGFFTISNEQRPIVFVAGGVGITPFISMIRYFNKHSILQKPILIYFNRDRDSAVYLDEIEGYKDTLIARSVTGPLTEDALDVVSNAPKFVWYIAGPLGMVKAARSLLEKMGVDETHLITEEFAGYE